jgi:hypothetical protein
LHVASRRSHCSLPPMAPLLCAGCLSLFKKKTRTRLSKETFFSDADLLSGTGKEYRPRCYFLSAGTRHLCVSLSLSVFLMFLGFPCLCFRLVLISRARRVLFFLIFLINQTRGWSIHLGFLWLSPLPLSRHERKILFRKFSCFLLFLFLIKTRNR